MDLPAALAADLVILTDALDEPGADVAVTLQRLAADARAAVRTFAGLTVIMTGVDPAFGFTMMDGSVEPGDIRASLMISLPPAQAEPCGAGVVLILYAQNRGAFVDLAADLSWLTGRELVDFALDRHLNGPVRPAAHATPHVTSLLNQAVGVLIGRGSTPEQADLDLDTRAADAGISRYEAARRVLNTLPSTNPR